MKHPSGPVANDNLDTRTVTSAVHLPDEEVFPLSFAQEQLWLADRLQGGAAYNVPVAVHLTGRFDVSVLERALAELVTRHEPLRTRIVATEDGPRQAVAPEGRLPLTVVDAAGSTADERRRDARRSLREDAARRFDLAAGPLARCLVVRIAPDEHAAQLVAHHVICDAWSLGILIREIGQLYDAFRSGQRSPLRELPLQYGDYAVWQRKMSASPAWERQRAYWRQRLAGVSALELPSDRTRSAAGSVTGAQVRFTIPGEVTTAIKDRAREAGATLFMALLAGFHALLARYTNQTDISVGTPVIDRPRAELEPVVGLFLNTIVIRADLSGRSSFRDVVRRIREETLRAFANRDVPFEQIVEELHPQRDAARNPLFDVLFTLQNAPHETLRLGDLEWRTEDTSNGTAKFDLTLFVQQQDHDLSAAIEYRTDLFDAATVERFARHYVALLRAGAERPDDSLDALNILDEEERDHLLRAGDRTAHPASLHKTVHEHFERAADRWPGRLAVAGEDARLTFRELEERSNQLARYLRRRGVGPDHRVGICLERSSEIAVAILGTLKAGAGYVPLDPALPSERLEYMVADSETAVLLTSAAVRGALGGSVARAVAVCLDEERDALASEDPARPLVPVDPRQLAYLIYTSGSTGRPKGVALSHEALSNLIAWYAAEMHAGPALQFASIGFDASLLEMLGPWSQGCAVYVAPDRVRVDPAALAVYLATHRIEKLFLPVVVLQRMAEAVDGREESLAAVREIITAGEQMRITPAVVRLMERLPQCALFNYYGPSETHNATALRLSGAPSQWEARPPIGYPIWNTRCYVLNGALQPVPRGGIGELFIGGAGVARGYWRQPALTAQRFVPDPFDGRGGRLYATGDLVRHLGSGAIQFVGRNDTQIKVRGCRVEPSEIETALLESLELREAAVVVQGDADDRRLIAYIVPRSGAAPGARAIRAALRGRLPEYMIPSAFVVLEQLPLNQNGKVDRRALPPAGAVDSHGPPPRTPVELIVAAAWQEVLDRDSVGMEHNLFDLGAHSLAIAQVANRLSHWFGIELQVSAVFSHPTVEAQADLVAASLGEPAARAAAEGLLHRWASSPRA